MNGQMYQIAAIVAAAKRAIRNNAEITYKPEKYIDNIRFQFLPSETGEYIAPDVPEWFERIKKHGVEDVKLLCPVSVKDKGVLGFSNTTQSSILCFYEDGKVTYFVPIWEFDTKLSGWNIMYTEYEWDNPPTGKPEYKNNTEEFRDILLRIEELAIRIECENFAKVFRYAIQCLDGEIEGHDAEYGLEFPQLPPENLKIFEAASTADVFGGMGSWNDEPGAMAGLKKLGKEYDDLSEELLRNVRLAILYSVNEW